MTPVKPTVQARTRPHAEPTADDLRSAFKLCKARSWPDEFEAAMADPERARLVHICAQGRMRRKPVLKLESLPPLGQEPMLRAWPPQRATSHPQYDCKRAAAGDTDD